MRVVDDGPADPDLAPEGEMQARRLADYMAVERVDAVYSSPLARAVQTAQPLADALSLPLHVEPGLAEWDRASSEYIPVEVMKATGHPHWEALVRGEWMAADESADEFRSRVVGTVEALIDRHPGGRIALVCHGGVVNAYLAHVLARVDGAPFFYPAYTSIHRVAAARTGERSIVSINETAHLRGTGLMSALHDKPERP